MSLVVVVYYTVSLVLGAAMSKTRRLAVDISDMHNIKQYQDITINSSLIETFFSSFGRNLPTENIWSQPIAIHNPTLIIQDFVRQTDLNNQYGMLVMTVAECLWNQFEYVLRILTKSEQSITYIY